METKTVMPIMEPLNTFSTSTTSTQQQQQQPIVPNNTKSDITIESTVNLNSVVSQPPEISTTNSESKIEKIETTNVIVAMNDSELKKIPGPGVDIKALKEGMKREQLGRGEHVETGHNIGEDVASISSHLSQMGYLNRNSPTAATAPASDFRERSSASASDFGLQQEQGDVIPIRGPGENKAAANATLTPKSFHSTSGSPSPLKTPSSRSFSAKERPLNTTSSERAFSTTANSRKTRTNNISNSPLAANHSPELLAKTFGGSTPSFHLRPSSSLYRHTSSFTAKKVSPQVASTSKLQLKSTKSFCGTTTQKTPSPYKVEMGDAGGGSPTPGGEKIDIRSQFAVFSRFGDSASDGKQITLSNCDKWMKQAHVIDGKKITTTDTSITFKKLFKTTKKVGFEDFKRYIEDLATAKKIEPQEILDKLANAGTPGLSQATKAAHVGVVERLTDTSKYTGSSKERFDSSGKGRGIGGRREVADNTGYTASFNEKKKEESSPAATSK